MSSIIKNFPKQVQEFLLEKEKELNSTFVGCLESDESFVFKDENKNLIIRFTVSCKNSKCEEYLYPKTLESVNKKSFGYNCPNCLEEY
jgi:hypothetical protein